MKKKSVARLSVIVIAIVLIAGGCYIFNDIFPKAKSIGFPAVESISSVYTSCNSTDVSTVLSKGSYANLIEYISSAKPTRKQSLNDRPTVFPYYMVGIKTSEREYRYFIYEEGTQVYIEMPYEGIYTSDMQLFQYVSKH